MNQATCAPHGQRTGGILSGLLAKILLTVTLCGAAVQALAQVCPGPGNLVAGPASGIVNNYYQANGNLSVGATSLVLGALDGRGMSTPMAVGDLLMIIQMQDASINTSNNNTYGDGSGTGQGATSVGRTGLYEWVRVTSTGASIGITPPLTNSYVQADAGGAPQKRYQVIRAMQYTSATANGVTAPAWNGLTGGVVAMDVRDTLTLGGGTVEGQANRAFFLAGKGFRGGAGRRLAVGGSSRNDYATPATTDYHAAKGEGIAGTPYYASRLTSNWGFQATNPPALAIDTLAPGYPGGSSARGAPGNAGGGGTDGRAVGSGNDENSGGGGGGNYGPGGTGGRPWNDPLYDTGGRGGAGYSGTLAFNRVFLGGGGGAGSSNDGTSDSVAYFNQAMGCNLGTLGLCSSGAAGGGIVLIRARSVTGSGVIDVRGAHAYNVGNDSGGGGGAAGSAVVQSLTGGNATIDARGGDGGNAWAGNAGGLPNRHGPGGAGGGGFIAYSPASMSLATQVDGGAPGKTMSDLVPDENYGSTGYNGGLTAFLAPNAPGVPQAALCDPSVSLAKTNGTTSLTSPGTVTYSLTVSNSGLGPTLGTVTVADKLPAGLSVAPGALTVSGPNAASWTCTAANSTDITCNTTGSIPGGGSSTFAIDVALSAANGSSIVNRARVTGGGDSGKPPSATPVADAEACTANNTPAGCALDSDTVVAPNLVLTKTDNTSTVVSGGTTTYVLVVSNTGGTATSGTIRVVDVLPTGLTFAGTTTTGAFTCTLAAPTLTCDQATALAAGASATITFRVTADAAAPSAVTNLARAGGGGDPSPGKPLPTAATAATCPAPVPPAETNSDPNTGCAADTSLVQYVSLALTKSDGASFVSQNGTTDYLFTISNIGTAPTSGTISFRDAFTSTMTVSGALATPFNPAGPNGANWTCVRNSTTDVSCTTVVSIAAGANSAFILTANVGAAGAGTQQRNKARIGGGGDVRAGMVTSPTSANVAACTTDGSPLGCAIDLNTVQAGAEVRMTKTHPNPQARSPGDTFSHTLLVTNSGGGAAGAGTVQVIDVVPAGLVIGAITVSGFAPCAVAGQVVTCTSDTNLPVGGSLSVTIPVTVSAGASNELINRAQVGTNGPDPQNNTFPTAASAGLCSGTDVPTLGCATDTVPLNADLQITKLQRRGTTDTFTTSVPVVPTGSTVQFRIDVTNSGPGNVNTATIADTVPVNFTNVTWACGNLAGTATCSAASGAGNAISLTGNISSGGSLRLTVTAVATFPTAVSGVVNTASVTAPTGIVDTNSANNSGTVTTTVGVTNLSITKTNGTTTVTSGGTTSYTIVVTNTGDYPADGARLYDPVVAGLSCTAPPICLAAGPATSCPIGLTAAQLQNATAPAGVAIPAFGAGGSITLTYACNVTATGQ